LKSHTQTGSQKHAQPKPFIVGRDQRPVPITRQIGRERIGVAVEQQSELRLATASSLAGARRQPTSTPALTSGGTGPLTVQGRIPARQPTGGRPGVVRNTSGRTSRRSSPRLSSIADDSSQSGPDANRARNHRRLGLRRMAHRERPTMKPAKPEPQACLPQPERPAWTQREPSSCRRPF